MQPVFAPRTTSARVSPRLAIILAAVLVPLALVLAFAWAPLDTISFDRGAVQYNFPQKIFYVHVPLAMAAYLAFFSGAWNAVLYLIKGDEDYDVRSYAGVHSGVVLGTLVLITGSLWAKVSWGTWWQWGDRQLLVFLTLYLFYSAYFVLRFSIDAGRSRARASAIYAVLGVALVPLSFFAIRISNTLIHPIVITPAGDNLPGAVWITFFVSLVGFAALAIVMLQLEVAAKLRHARGYAATDERGAAQEVAATEARETAHA
ncbi:MAG: cytochrome c biogenesis protein CcsA [Thermoleophilia bacterium]|nr:cytochrome c biogenesis protein CcsA [Thermoleophilia bacterium]